jgi:hypothetical protein
MCESFPSEHSGTVDCFVSPANRPCIADHILNYVRSAKSHKYHLNDTTAPKGLPSPPPEAVTGSRFDGSPLPISDGGSYTRLPQHRNAPSFTSAPLSPRTLASLEIQALLLLFFALIHKDRR